MKNSFSSKIGVLLAAAGSAVGLGSIWKFPYIVGENGGGAFIILYIACSMIFGLPLVIVDDRRHQLAQGDGLQSVRRCQHAGHRHPDTRRRHGHGIVYRMVRSEGKVSRLTPGHTHLSVHPALARTYSPHPHFP